MEVTQVSRSIYADVSADETRVAIMEGGKLVDISILLRKYH